MARNVDRRPKPESRPERIFCRTPARIAGFRLQPDTRVAIRCVPNLERKE